MCFLRRAASAIPSLCSRLFVLLNYGVLWWLLNVWGGDERRMENLLREIIKKASLMAPNFWEKRSSDPCFPNGESALGISRLIKKHQPDGIYLSETFFGRILFPSHRLCEILSGKINLFLFIRQHFCVSGLPASLSLPKRWPEFVCRVPLFRSLFAFFCGDNNAFCPSGPISLGTESETPKTK